MKIAYLVLAHRNPRLLVKMIERLACEKSAFFIHLDKKSNIENFRLAKGGNVFFSEERIPVYWAEYSMVEAILILIKQALNDVNNYEYFVLLSGSDYPLRGKEYISNFLDERKGAEFIALAKVPSVEAGVPLSKISTFSIPSDRPILQFIGKACAKIGFTRRDYRKFLGDLQPYAGSTWWALSRDACQYILNFVQENDKVCKFFSKTITSDEMLFHTIIGNSPFKQNIRRNIMFEKWSQDHVHPEMINENHIFEFESQKEVNLKDPFGPGEALFARKFSDKTLDLTKRIDKMIIDKERASSKH